VATITRLLDMGVEDYLLASTVTAIVAQRLVRRLCPQCSKRQTSLPPAIRRAAENCGISTRAQCAVRAPRGCASCLGTGYAGRTTVSEILTLDHELRRLITSGASERELLERARESGYRTMFEDGLDLVLAGETTFEDVLRVAHDG
jgi:general secretion pathway protein E